MPHEHLLRQHAELTARQRRITEDLLRPMTGSTITLTRSYQGTR